MVTEIIAGIVIGPHILDIANVDEPVQVLSQIGLVFVFFLAGSRSPSTPKARPTCGSPGSASWRRSACQ